MLNNNTVNGVADKAKDALGNVAEGAQKIIEEQGKKVHLRTGELADQAGEKISEAVSDVGGKIKGLFNKDK